MEEKKAKEARQKAALVGLARDSGDQEECQRSLCELERLLDTAGGVCEIRMIQIRPAPDVRTCIGRGKVAELREICAEREITLVVFDTELTPSQIRNLEEELGEAEVIDRSMLILDIFAMHAVTGEGKLQVELAQLRYTAPRLIGKGKTLSRLGGTIGTRGPGESQLERDRRHIHRRIEALEAQLRSMEENRATMRAARDRSGMPKVAIVGYTNAGKSTLLNCLTGAGVLSQDKLFATLDPTTRRLELPEKEYVLLTDTVGFIRKLPHHLIRAFRSTLEEAAYADILLLMVDATDPEAEEHLKVTGDLLAELGAGDKPRLYVFNKCDLLESVPPAAKGREHVLFISAATGKGTDMLLHALLRIVREGHRRVRLRIPYDEQGKLHVVHESGRVEKIGYEETGIVVDAVLDPRGVGMLRKYILPGEEWREHDAEHRI